MLTPDEVFHVKHDVKIGYLVTAPPLGTRVRVVYNGGRMTLPVLRTAAPAFPRPTCRPSDDRPLALPRTYSDGETRRLVQEAVEEAQRERLDAGYGWSPLRALAPPRSV